MKRRTQDEQRDACIDFALEGGGKPKDGQDSVKWLSADMKVLEKTKQIERIERMEQHLERVMQAAKGGDDALDYEAVQEALRELEAYYGSDMWKQDFEDDEQGKLPKNLKRGVLSEDAIWNVLEDYRRITNTTTTA